MYYYNSQMQHISLSYFDVGMCAGLLDEVQVLAKSQVKNPFKESQDLK